MNAWMYAAIAIALISFALAALDSDTMPGAKKLVIIIGCAVGVFMLLVDIARMQ